jgi:hypothetical protein
MRIFRRPDGRYYLIAEAQPDLLGDSVILTLHGSVHSRRGGVHTYLSSVTCIDDLVKTRLRHGYTEDLNDIDAVES